MALCFTTLRKQVAPDGSLPVDLGRAGFRHAFYIERLLKTDGMVFVSLTHPDGSGQVVRHLFLSCDQARKPSTLIVVRHHTRLNEEIGKRLCNVGSRIAAPREVDQSEISPIEAGAVCIVIPFPKKLELNQMQRGRRAG